MKPFFALAPWEYAGAIFDSDPHAIVHGSVNGQGKVWWLKARDGILYFRDAAKVQVYAIPTLFEELSADDSENLIRIWQREIARENYGAYIVTRRIWPGTRARSSFCIIIRVDGSGLIREHFDVNWRQFEVALKRPLRFWSLNESGGEVEAVIKQTRAEFLERAVDACHFASIPEQWRRGCIADNDAPAEMLRVMTSATKLWAPEGYYTKPQTLNCRSNSDFFAGGVGDRFVFDCHVRVRQIWELARWHFGYVGIEWQRASENAALQAQYGPRVWKRNFDKYGENWRGNWVAHQGCSQLELPATAGASMHEKLEAALFMREWLRDKVPNEKVKAWIEQALSV